MKLFKNKYIKLELSSNVFHPTGTSDLLIETIKDNLRLNGTVLDVGAGSGYVGIALLKIFKKKFKLSASDLDKKTINLIKLNAKKNCVNINAKKGDLFKPWKKEKFNFIINDVSGIAEKIAKISPWFNRVSCMAGEDGTKLVKKVINEADNHLLKEGVLIFPVLSFSNTSKIIKYAKNKFKYVKKISSKQWLLPKTMYKDIATLKKLKKKKIINYKVNFGMLLWKTDIYFAFNSSSINKKLNLKK